MKESPLALASSPALAPADTRLYAVGDLHGRHDLLLRLLAMIEADAGQSRAARKLVVFLGDYIDRGPDSADILATLLAGPPPEALDRGFAWICLSGNHEEQMQGFLDDADLAEGWLRNGGLETIRSYAGRSFCAEDPPLLLQRALRAALPVAHRDFLAGLPVWHVEGGYLFVHAGIRPGVPLAAQDSADLLWIRREFLDSQADHGYLVVHGHTIVAEPTRLSNRIALDTGAYRTGRLTAMVAEGEEVRFLST